MPTITAEITARGAKSTVPEEPGAVDARILVDGREIGEVTLVPDHDGRLDAWGSPENWSSSALLKWLDDRVDYLLDDHDHEDDPKAAAVSHRSHLCDAIVAAVRAVA